MATNQSISRRTVHCAALGGAFCCALLAGCATQDKAGAAASVAVANAAVADAAASGATGDILAARMALSEATAALNQKEYDRARLLALQAETEATLARARTSSAKAQTAANEINESTRLLRDELGRARQ